MKSANPDGVKIEFEAYRDIINKVLWFAFALFLYGLIGDGKDVLGDSKAIALYSFAILVFITATAMMLYVTKRTKEKLSAEEAV